MLIAVGSLKGDTVELDINGKKLGIVRVDQPRVQHVDKMNVVKGMDKSLSNITGLGKGDWICNYTYAVNEKTQPEMSVTIGDQEPFKIVWDPKTRKILRYKDWEYTKTRDRKHDWDVIELTRKDSTGEVESYYCDFDGGITVNQWNDSKRSEYRFTSGLADGKVRKIEDRLNGKITHVQQYAYDEKGRMIRGRENGEHHKFEYDDQNRTATAWKNGNMLWKKYMDVQDRIQKVEYPDGKTLVLKHHENRPTEAELTWSGSSVSVQLNNDGGIKDGTEIIK